MSVEAARGSRQTRMCAAEALENMCARYCVCARALCCSCPHSYVGELSQEAAVAFGKSVPSSLFTGPAVIYVWQCMFGRWLSSK